MKIAVIFDNFGPYHIARLTALSSKCEIIAIEIRHQSLEYEWHLNKNYDFANITLSSPTPTELRKVLNIANPDVILIPGWSSPAALTALAWCRRHDVPGIIMSDSQTIDFPRNPLKEWFKSLIVRNASAGFVAGTPHRSYLQSLGISTDFTMVGYDVVDNDYFILHTNRVRKNADTLRKNLKLPTHFILASARFIPRKNLVRLIEAFAICRNRHIESWSLVILGDGEMKPMIKKLITDMQLDEFIITPGFRQYQELPTWFGLAEAFVLASTSEQWGLVVNEAMASALPVLVSNRCGCAADLVVEDKTGFTFDPDQTLEIVAKLDRIMCMSSADRQDMGRNARAHIAAFSPDVFAHNAIFLAQKVTRKSSHRRRNIFGALFLSAIAYIAEKKGHQ